MSVVSVSINKILHTAASTAIIFKMIEIIFRFGFKTNANFGRPSDSKLMSIFLVRYSSLKIIGCSVRCLIWFYRVNHLAFFRLYKKNDILNWFLKPAITTISASFETSAFIAFEIKICCPSRSVFGISCCKRSKYSEFFSCLWFDIKSWQIHTCFMYSNLESLNSCQKS